MTTTAKQRAALGRIMDTDGGVKSTRVYPSGELMVTFQDGTHVLVSRDGSVTK